MLYVKNVPNWERAVRVVLGIAGLAVAAMTRELSSSRPSRSYSHASDGFHPGAAGCEVWAQALARTIAVLPPQK